MKNVVPVVIILVLLAVGGYFYMRSKKVMPGNTNIMIGKNPNQPAGNAFASIQDALSRSLSLECNYKDEKGVQTTTYVKGGAVRVVMAGVVEQQQPNNIIMKDKKIYMWNDVSKTGFTYTMTAPVVTGTVAAPTEQPSSTDKQASVMASIEKYKNDCKVGTVSDSFFQIPTNVNFQDMSSFTQQLMKQVPQVPSQPVGGQNAADYQNYINQMKQQAGGQ